MSNAGQQNSSREGVKDWTKAQADQITSLYRSLHGEYQAEANKRLFDGPQLPYEHAHHILADLLENQDGHKHKESGLENVVKEPTPLLDLSAIAASAGLAVVTHPIVGILAGSLYCYASNCRYISRFALFYV